jgi:hypothetical protein
LNYFGIEYRNDVQFLVDGTPVKSPDMENPIQFNSTQVMSHASVGEYRLEARVIRDLDMGDHGYALINATGSVTMESGAGLIPGASGDCTFQVNYGILVVDLSFGGDDYINEKVPWSGAVVFGGTTIYSCPDEAEPQLIGEWSIQVTFKADSAITRITHGSVFWEFKETIEEGYSLWAI